MNSKELRIGNTILNTQGTPIEVGLLQIKYAKDFKPIPLTEEWLVRFGFEIYQSYGCINQEPDKFKYRKAIFNNSFLKFDTNFSGWFRIDRTTVSSTCWYVHQLQNLYFALTNEELKLQP